MKQRTHKNPGKQRPGRQHGFSLIEILIAVLVVSVGLLGIAGMQVYSLKSNQVAYMRSQAAIMAYDITDRMRANREAAMAGKYDITLAAGSASGGGLAANDVDGWLQTLADAMPSGDGAVAVNNANGIATITVEWLDDREQTGDAAKQTFVIETKL